MYENRENRLRWLKVLFYIHLAGTFLSALILAATAVPFAVGTWYTWAQRAVSLGVAVCLYLLSGRYYRNAGVVKAAAVILEWLPLGLHALLRLDVQSYTFWLGLLGRASVALSLIALSLEYIGHAAGSPVDKRKWVVLLICSFTVSLLSTMAASLLQPILQTMEMEASLRISKVWNVAVRSLSLAFSAANLVLLHRLIRYQEEVD